MRRELDAECRRPVDDIVVELREQLDEVKPVTHQVEAELLQMILGEQEDSAAVDVVRKKVGSEISKPKRIEPRSELLAVPREHIAV